MKKIVSIILSVVLMITFSVPTYGKTVSTEYAGADLDTPLEENLQANAAVGEKLNINAKAAILIEKHTGKILYEMNADEKLAPASITKIMTLILVMEALEEERLALDTKITASEHAASRRFTNLA